MLRRGDNKIVNIGNLAQNGGGGVCVWGGGGLNHSYLSNIICALTTFPGNSWGQAVKIVLILETRRLCTELDQMFRSMVGSYG